MAGSASAAMLTGPGTAICRGCGRPGIEATYLTVNLGLNLVFTISLVLLIGPIGTAVATGLTWALSSILFLIVLHLRLDLPVQASQRAAGTAVLAAAVAAIVFWTSGVLGLPDGRQDAFWSTAWLGTISGVVYVGLATLLRLVSLRDAFRELRAMVRRSP
jgi:O-antigen/teichoic acid export membrane protein